MNFTEVRAWIYLYVKVIILKMQPDINLIDEPGHSKTYKIKSEDSDQPAHPYSLISQCCQHKTI